MSSIYKKGRDGYYYYQTYVYNSESKKKDKRIFYALGTKDLLEAKTKQHELDLKHEKQNYIIPNSSKSSNYFKIKPAIAIIVSVIVITILLVNFYKLDNFEQYSSSSIINEEVVNAQEKIHNTSKTIDSLKSTIIEQIDSKIENIPEIKKTNPEPIIDEPKVIIPKYFVERVYKLSEAFEQGKVCVTIDKNSSNKSQKLLCENLTKRFSEFSNIVICLYSNDRAGKDLANGNDETVSIEEQKRSWLAMYTYNSVEGEYFDDNPSGYLSIY